MLRAQLQMAEKELRFYAAEESVLTCCVILARFCFLTDFHYHAESIQLNDPGFAARRFIYLSSCF